VEATAGCVVGRRLAERGDRSVLLLEAGPDLGTSPPRALRDGWGLPSGPTWPYDWGFESEPDANGATGVLRRGRLLGGTSWLTRFAVRGHPADFDAWAAGGNPGWSFEDVLPTFRTIEADVEFGDRPWHGERGPIPITRYPDDEPAEIHAAALRAFGALGFPDVEDHNEPRRDWRRSDADELAKRAEDHVARCVPPGQRDPAKPDDPAGYDRGVGRRRGRPGDGRSAGRRYGDRGRLDRRGRRASTAPRRSSSARGSGPRRT